MKPNLQHILVYWLGMGMVSVSLSNPPSPRTSQEDRIEWKRIPYASEYHLQIQDFRGNRIVDEKLQKNFYAIHHLPSGKYKIRVGVVSPFGTTVIWSKWRSLEIVESEPSFLAKQEVEKNQASSEKVSHSPEPQSISSSNSVTGISKVENISTPATSLKTPRNLSTLPLPASSSEKFLTLPGTFLNCNATQIPKEVIKECNQDYIVLDLSSPQKRSLYNAFVLESRNRIARIQIARFYQENCKMADERIVSKFNDLHNSSDLSSEERTEIQKSLKAILFCR